MTEKTYDWADRSVKTKSLLPGKSVTEINKALLDRPRVSLRMQMFLGFLAPFFLVAAGMAIMLIYNFDSIESKIRFLEIFNDYAIEVVQARRFEKNFLLYGSNLEDALDYVLQAEQILASNSEELSEVMGRQWSQTMLHRLQSYQGLLRKIGTLDPTGSPEFDRKKLQLQDQLRKEGQELITAAKSLIFREKASLNATTRNALQILIFSLTITLLGMAVAAFLLGSRMLKSLRNIGEHANQIALGQFDPITPTRPFRDEFTSLALAINVMVEELDKRESILIQSHKMRAVGTLTAGVAHELNNPLNNITLSAHVLKEDYADLDDDQRLEMISDIVAESGRAKTIIKNLLDFARESGSLMEPLDLPRLLQETIALAANQIKLMGIKIELQSTDNLPRVHGDTQQLQQVFLNLLLNAIDASHKGDKIQVLVAPADEPNYLAVKIIDFGSGIPEHILTSIFDPFFTTKAKGKGTGLGLSVSQGLVTKHGGRILVSSRPDHGSIFTVLLPVTTIPAEIGIPREILRKTEENG
ncbi:MAG: HAMP domain-containing histidine kinase [Proteobacteria bacterium]|nr:HAMP domain-containing histidine kinase [Pseudomonadota bacterium]